MTKPIEQYTADELSAKIEAIKAEREKTANALKRYEDELEHENSALQYKLDKAVEALKFYAEQQHYLDHCRDYSEYDNADWIEGNVENGQKAREALEEIENDKL